MVRPSTLKSRWKFDDSNNKDTLLSPSKNAFIGVALNSTITKADSLMNKICYSAKNTSIQSVLLGAQYTEQSTDILKILGFKFRYA